MRSEVWNGCKTASRVHLTLNMHNSTTLVRWYSVRSIYFAFEKHSKLTDLEYLYDWVSRTFRTPSPPLFHKLACCAGACCSCFGRMFIFFWIHASPVVSCLQTSELNCKFFIAFIIILVLFTVPFYNLLFSRYLDLTKHHFSSDILVPFSDSGYLCNCKRQ